MHANTGALQALMDNELDQPQRSAVEAHLFGCEQCAADLRELRAASAAFATAVADLEVDLPFGAIAERFEAVREEAGVPAEPQPVVVIHRERRVVTWTRSALLKAAGIGVLIAGAASAAIPGTPVRELVEDLLGLNDEVAPVPTQIVPPAPVEQVEPAVVVQDQEPPFFVGMDEPSDNLQLTLSSMGADALLVIRYVDSGNMTIRLRDRSGVITESFANGFALSNLGNRDVYVDLPRSASNVRITVGGAVMLSKENGNTRTAPALEATQDRVVIQPGR